MHLARMAAADKGIDWVKEQPRWDVIMQVRNDVLRVLEGLRQNKEITSNQQESVVLECASEEEFNILEKFGAERMAALCIISEIKIKTGGGGERIVTAKKSEHQKCQRCWNYWPSVGKDEKYPDLCARCSDVVKSF